MSSIKLTQLENRDVPFGSKSLRKITEDRNRTESAIQGEAEESNDTSAAIDCKTNERIGNAIGKTFRFAARATNLQSFVSANRNPRSSSLPPPIGSAVGLASALAQGENACDTRPLDRSQFTAIIRGDNRAQVKLALECLPSNWRLRGLRGK